MKELDPIKEILKSAFPENFSDCRFPYTYHHDYARGYHLGYEGKSRAEIASDMESRVGTTEEYHYELVKWSTLYLIANHPHEFDSAIATNEQFWKLLQSIRTFESFNKSAIAIDRSQIEIEVEAIEEHIPVRGNAIWGGSAEERRRVEDRILRDLKKNQWAWCTVCVTASCMGVEGEAYLGACSYKSKEDFIQNSGYYEDLKEEAIADLTRKLEAMP